MVLPFDVSGESLMSWLVLPAVAGYTELRMKYASKSHAHAVKDSLTKDIQEIKLLMTQLSTTVTINIETSKEIHGKLEKNIEAVQERLLELEHNVKN